MKLFKYYLILLFLFAIFVPCTKIKANSIIDVNVIEPVMEQLLPPEVNTIKGFDDIPLRKPEPGPWALELSENKNLIEARKYDLQFNTSGTANQELAERNYLKFISEEPNDSLVPYIYHRIANNLLDFVTEQHQKNGAIRNYEKAMGYYEKCVNAYPEDKIDMYMVGSKVNIAALQPTQEKVVSKYIEYYKWLEEISETKKDILSQGLQKFIDTQITIAATNMVNEASGSPDVIRLDLLKQIMDELPNAEPGRLASEKIKEYGNVQLMESSDYDLSNLNLSTTRINNQEIESISESSSEMEININNNQDKSVREIDNGSKTKQNQIATISKISIAVISLIIFSVIGIVFYTYKVKKV